MIPRHCRDRKPVWKICAAALLCAAAGVQAQTFDKEAAAAALAMERTNAWAPRPVISPRRGARIDANEAGRRLALAKLQREQGTHPLPGEMGRGNDAGMVNHDYWRRQERLRQVAEQALRRYNETRRP